MAHSQELPSIEEFADRDYLDLFVEGAQRVYRTSLSELDERRVDAIREFVVDWYSTDWAWIRPIPLFQLATHLRYTMDRGTPEANQAILGRLEREVGFRFTHTDYEF